MKKIIIAILLASISSLSHAYSHETCKYLTGNEYWECRAKPNFMRFSDSKLKKNSVKIDNALDKVSRLNGVTFEWKKNSQKDIGVIAQNVEQVFPELVNEVTVQDETEGSDKTFKQVSYAGLVGVLIEAVKDLKKDNEELRQQLGL